MHNLGKCYTKDANIVSRRISEELILVPIRQNIGDLGSVYVLNEVAGRAWELTDGSRQVEEVRDCILNEFDVDTEEAEADLLALFDQFEEIGVVTAKEA